MARRHRRRKLSISTAGAVAGLVVLAVVTGTLATFALTQRPAASTTVSGGTSGGFVATSTPEPALLELPSPANVLMLGDSYMLGTGADDRRSTAWAPQVAAALGWNATIDGLGGTGFTVGRPDTGSGRFIERIQARAGEAYDLVFIEGGQNDHLASKEELHVAVNEVIVTAQAQWPEAKIIVMGPTAPEPLGSMLGRISEPITAEAQALGVLAINPIQSKWMTVENSPGFDLDGAHVNQAGHDYITQKVMEQIATWSTAS